MTRRVLATAVVAAVAAGAVSVATATIPGAGGVPGSLDVKCQDDHANVE
jgi:hypothetical protein